MEKTLEYTLKLEDWDLTEHGRVRNVLTHKLHLSRHEISRLKFAGEILVNGKQVHTDAFMRVGDRLVVKFPDDEMTAALENSEEPEILYEEEDFVIVNKPAGIVVHPSHDHLEDSLGTMLQGHYLRLNQNFMIRPIGRLDKDVSGVQLYAKNQPAAARLSAQRDNQQLHKGYIAIVKGTMGQKSGTINAPVEKIEGQRQRVVSEEGKDAVTNWRVMRELSVSGTEVSVLWVEIATGRTHQIRTHMASIGHPLIGDELYGGDLKLIKRPALHCAAISLRSPFTGTPISVRATLPTDMSSLIRYGTVIHSTLQEQNTKTIQTVIDEAWNNIEKQGEQAHQEVADAISQSAALRLQKQLQKESLEELVNETMAIQKPEENKAEKAEPADDEEAALERTKSLLFKGDTDEISSAEEEEPEEPAVEAVQDQKEPKKKHHGRRILLIVLIIVIAAAVCWYVFQNSTSANAENLQTDSNSVDLSEQRSQIYDDLVLDIDPVITLQYGADFNAEDYIKNEYTGTLRMAGSVNTEKAGMQRVIYILSDTDSSGRAVTRSTSVRFVVAQPQGSDIVFLQPEVTIYVNDSFNPADNIMTVAADGADLLYSKNMQPSSYMIESNVDTASAGTYTVTVRAFDRNGSESDASYKVTVAEADAEAEASSTPSAVPSPSASAEPSASSDTTAPVIHVRNSSVTITSGDAFDYGSNIDPVTDETDGVLKYSSKGGRGTFTIQSDGNGITQPGTSTVTITATDRSGNTSSASYQLIVRPAPTPTPASSPTPSPAASASVKADSADPSGQIYSFLTTSMGLNRAQAVGILTNILRESSYRPTADNGIGYYGLCQWGGDRLENLKNWCSANGYDYTTIDGQMHFLAYEMPLSYPNTYGQLTACQDSAEGAGQAAWIFAKGYEVAGDYYAEQSQAAAEAMYQS